MSISSIAKRVCCMVSRYLVCESEFIIIVLFSIWCWPCVAHANMFNQTKWYENYILNLSSNRLELFSLAENVL